MARRLRQHINPLKMSVLVPRADYLPLPADKEVEVELGCGDAHFLIQRAAREPGIHFVGLDIRDDFLAFGRQEIATQRLTNIELHVSNLIVDSARLFAPQRVRRYYINFPDPWFKRRQHNRRWFDAPVLDQLVDTLLDEDGEILYQTDVWDLAIEALGLLEANERLFNVAGPWTFLRRHEFGLQTSREIACLEEGREIWRMLFRKSKR